jgi:hypothetical protein
LSRSFSFESGWLTPVPFGSGSQLWVISQDKRLSEKGAQQFSSERGAVVKRLVEKELKLFRQDDKLVEPHSTP